MDTSYEPHPDGEPDPGEVVWAWVPYEDDPSQGKDRPVLLVGRDGDVLLGLQLTSKDHDRDAEDEAATAATGWTSAAATGTGSGGTARCGSTGCCGCRPRRSGARAPRSTRDVFDAVVAAAREHHAL